jgi:hypothetical protein
MLLPLGKALQLLLKKVIDIYEKEIQELSIKSAECRYMPVVPTAAVS